MTIRLDHLLIAILGIAVAALALFFGAERLVHHSHAGMAIQPEQAQAIEAGFLRKASTQGEVAQCSPSTYEITCSVAGNDSVVHRVQITRLNFCTYSATGDGISATLNECSHEKTVHRSSHAALVAAMSTVRATIPDMEAYYADNNSYRGATTSVLRSTYDRGLPARGVSVVSAGAENYCLQGTVDGQTASVSGPGGTVKQGPCP